MKNQDTIPFPDELTHLDQILKKIDTEWKIAREDVLRLDQEYRDAKRYMADYRNEMDSHEKLQNERLMNQTDRTGAFAVEVREKLEKLIRDQNLVSFVYPALVQLQEENLKTVAQHLEQEYMMILI